MLVGDAMFAFLTKFLLVVRSRLKSRARLEAEILVLRQQVIVLSRKSGSRVWMRNIDRLVLVWIYRLFPSIPDAITVVKPETVIRWHRRGFRAYWPWKSRQRGGRPRIDRETRVCLVKTPSAPKTQDFRAAPPATGISLLRPENSLIRENKSLLPKTNSLFS